MHICMHAMHAYVGACMPCMHMPTCIRMHACICRCGHAGAYIHAYAHAYACICMLACIFHSLGQPIPGTLPWGGTVKPGTQDIYIYVIYMSLRHLEDLEVVPHPPKYLSGTCPFEHLKDLEVVPRPNKCFSQH